MPLGDVFQPFSITSYSVWGSVVSEILASPPREPLGNHSHRRRAVTTETDAKR